MYNLTLIQKYNGRLMISGNPIQISAAVTPGINSQLYVLVTVSVQNAPNSIVYNVIKSQKVVLSSAGLFQYDISSIVDPYLEFFIPPANLDNTVVCNKQVKNFTVQMELYNNTVKESTITDTVRVIKAGAAYEYFLPIIGNLLYSDQEHYLFTSTLSENASNLAEKVFADDWFWLYLLIPSNTSNPHLYYFDYNIEYLDADNTIKTATGQLHAAINPDNESRVICLPGGFLQNKLDKKIPAGSTAISYFLDLYFLVGVTKTRRNFEKLVFTIEQRNFYKRRQLVYRNSLGSLVPLTIRGTIEEEAAYDSQLSNTRPLDWLKNRNVVGSMQQGSTTEEYKFKGETGLITKFEADRVRDFFLSTERYEYKDARLVPIIVNSKNVKYYSSTDSLYSIAIEWQYAFSNSFYTAPDLSSKSCPAMLNFFWKQSFNDNIQVYYWLPSGYNYFRVTVQFPGEDPQYYFVEGNTGVASIRFARPASATGNVDIVVSAQVMCNRFNKMPSYGLVFNTIPQNLSAVLQPYAGNDVFTLVPGHSTAVVLSPSVLANDFDPNGSAIEAIVVTLAATTAGGVISINAAGDVTYLPPSPTFTGVDSFVYQMQLVSGGSPINGNITFNITAAPSGTGIFAYVEYADYEWVYFSPIAHSIYIDLGDGPGISPSPVVGNNLTVNYRKYVDTYSAFDNFATYSRVTTDHSVVINGVTKVKVYSGPIEEYFPDINGFLTIRKNTQIVVLPGTGYTVR